MSCDCECLMLAIINDILVMMPSPKKKQCNVLYNHDVEQLPTGITSIIDCTISFALTSIISVSWRTIGMTMDIDCQRIPHQRNQPGAMLIYVNVVNNIYYVIMYTIGPQICPSHCTTVPATMSSREQR